MRHCEEHSDEAIHTPPLWIATSGVALLAMTIIKILKNIRALCKAVAFVSSAPKKFDILFKLHLYT
jgi:hypothetical protein